MSASPEKNVLHARTQYEKQQPSVHGDQTRWEKFSAGSTTPPALAVVFGNTNADARSLCDS